MPSNNVGRNWKHTKESSLFGTRKLAFYTLTANPSNNLVGLWSTGCSFRINTATGAVTYNATITPRNTSAMVEVPTGELDDDYVELTVPWTFSFLGGGDTASIFINSNGGFSFYNGSSYRGANNPDDNGEKEVWIANNDGDLQYLYTETSGDSGTQQFRVKFLGNTDFTNDSIVNFVYEVVFYEDNLGYIDVLITQQPTDWNAYNDGQGNVVWGVTDGTNWVDGLSGDHFAQNFFGEILSSEEKLWENSNSAYYKVLQAIQQSGAELYWVGKPRNNAQTNSVDWTALTFADTDDSFTFAIADDADAPVATLDEVWTSNVVSIGANDPSTFDLDGNPPTLYIGQRITFSGDVFGGVVAGKDYYIKDKGTYDSGNKTWITISETADPEVLDIVLPKVVGGEPGPEFESDTNLDPGTTMTVTFYNYDVEWQGTAGDYLSSCCSNITTPGVIPSRLSWFISNSNALPDYWWIERANPSYGIFPAWWQNNI